LQALAACGLPTSTRLQALAAGAGPEEGPLQHVYRALVSPHPASMPSIGVLKWPQSDGAVGLIETGNRA
jgi:hypothetical protein